MIKKEKIIIPTYKTGKPEDLPMFFEKRAFQGASGKVYPLPYTSAISDEKEDKEYEAYIIENEYIKVTCLPEIGGKIHSILDKTNNYDIVYNNKVIKPAMVGLAGPWVSGGIEFNWPEHHRPTTFMPVDASEINNAVVMGEIDDLFNMHGTVAVSVEDDATYVKGHIRVYNSSPFARRFMWWANVAVEINDNYAVDFAPDVNFVNDHDRRCVLSWPIAKGVNKSARPWNYGEGVDIHFTRNIVPGTSLMISKDKCIYDFCGGYDYGKKAGIMIIANHHTCPGKKLWIWGNTPFAHKWCENLTDDGSQYCEIMAGCYTDNQPDFTMIEPYEMKEFDQYWYPIREIGEPKCATLDGALNITYENEKITLGLHMTREFKGSKIQVFEKDNEIYSLVADIGARKPFITDFSFKGNYEDVYTKIVSKEGTLLLEFKVKQPYHEPIEPRLPSPRPEEIKTNDELLLHGYHLYQYNHFAYKAEDYFLEGLRRDPTDYRLNEAMGDLCIDAGKFIEAKEYYYKAVRKSCLRDENPINAKAYYKLGLVNRFLGNDDEAYDAYYHAIWQYATRSESYYGLAAIEAKRNHIKEAVRLLDLSLETNQKHILALYMRWVLSKDQSYLDKAKEYDPLLFIKMESKHALFFTRELINFGLYQEALKMLDEVKQTPITLFYQGYIHHLLKNDNKANEYKTKAEKENHYLVFPNSLEDIKVFEWADTPMANYYLGCIYYHRDVYLKARTCFEKTIEKIEFAPAYRNLALCLFDHFNEKAEAYALLTKAFALDPTNGRLLSELVLMQSNMKNFSIQDKCDFIKEHYELASKRDDVLLKYAFYLTLLKEYDKAFEVMSSHSFHTYEGGEGILTGHHANLSLLVGHKLMNEGKYQEAEKVLLNGVIYPLNYHETVTPHVDETHIYYYLGKLYQLMGKEDLAKKYYIKGTTSYSGPNPYFYYQALCFDALSDHKNALRKIEELLSMSNDLLNNADIESYYGVGAPSRTSFALDTTKFNTQRALESRMFAYHYLNRDNEALNDWHQVNKMDNSSILAYIFQELLLK